MPWPGSTAIPIITIIWYVLGCARVNDFNDFKLDRFVLPNARHTGFEIADYSIHFEGYCQECRRKNPKPAKPRVGLRREKQ